MNKWQERNEPVIREFRENGGKVKGWAPLILLTTKGAKTGQPRIIPLMYVPYGNQILAIASKGGSVKHPEWYYNVLAHPDVTVEVGNEKFETTARILTGAEREKAFEKAVRSSLPMVSIRRKRLAKSLSLLSNDLPTRAKYNHTTSAAFSMLDEQLTFRRSCVIVLI